MGCGDELSEQPTGQRATRDRLLDATERILIEGGHSQVSTRHVAERAGVAHGLIRYHFGSLDDLMQATLERACGEILRRQRELYASDLPFIDKWRMAMGYIDVDLEAGFPKLVAELIARSWNEPSWQPVIRQTMAGFDEVLGAAVEAATGEYGLSDVDVAAFATLLRTFQLGVLVDRLSGVDSGHAHLNEVIDAWLTRMQQNSADSDARLGKG